MYKDFITTKMGTNQSFKTNEYVNQ